MVVHACDSNYRGGRGWRILSLRPAHAKGIETQSLKQIRNKGESPSSSKKKGKKKSHPLSILLG
jgi:hypothetical protein